jgi:NCAIR mutase (PurE)-related protein
MQRDDLRKMLEGVQAGGVDVDVAIDSLSKLPFVDTGDARVDTHRALRHGVPEVVFGVGKTVDQILGVIRALSDAGQDVLVTRIESEPAARVLAERPGGHYEEAGRLLWYGREEVPDSGKGRIGVVSAGTADWPVAAEAAGVARRLGNRVDVLQDVGVAGIHRLFAHEDVLREARVLIVVAGMEGALPSVVGGMVDKPVIAVPTSVGYGAALGGVAALLGMLTSCASNVVVVNIDNGFGAAYAATLINRL